MLTGLILLSEKEEDERSFSNLASTHMHTHTTVGEPSGIVLLANHRDRDGDRADRRRSREVRRETAVLCVSEWVCNTRAQRQLIQQTKI